MRTLYLLRHAKSDWSDATLSDFDRPLNHRGHKAAKSIGESMRERGIEPDLVLASPAVRAQETLARVQHAYGAQLPVKNEPRIYEASPNTLIEVIREAHDSAERLMLVGHNPGFHQVVLALSTDGELRREAEEKFPTGALAAIAFDVGSWGEIAPETGELTLLLKPRDL
jgi:phosphohistidine phosphatase